MRGDSLGSTLYVVATPIGNLGDLSRRALEVLQQAALIAAEDTRHSQRLLQHFAIDTPLCAYHEHSGEGAAERILDCLASGASVALISDAGTPLISDPGYRLVRQVQERGFRVSPIPGPCAATAALSASGLPTDRFLFEGFLPARSGARRNRLEALAAQSATLVFYEAPHRVLESLDDMVAVLGAGREAALAREVSKTYETIHRSDLQGLRTFVAETPHQQRGEIVLMVAGAREQREAMDPATLQLLERLAEELPPKRAAAVVADLSGQRKKVLYEHLTGRRGVPLADGDGQG